MLSSLAAKFLALLRGRLGIVLVGLAGAALTLVIALALREADSRSIRQEFERRASLRHELLRANLREYDGALFALRLLIENSDTLSSQEFDQAARRLASRIPGIQAVQWVPLVNSADLDGFTAAVRRTIDPGFTPRERQPDGSLRPIAPPFARDEHALITYIHPREGNEIALGYDIYTAPTASTLRRARALPGVPALSAAFPLIQGGQGLVYCLFLTHSAPHSGPPPGGGDGFIQIVLRLDSASSNFFLVSLRPVHDTLILDVTDDPPVPVYLHHSNGSSPEILPSAAPVGFQTADTFVRDLPVGGRLWRVYFRPSPSWLSSRRSLAPHFTLVGGGLFTLLGMAYLGTLRRQTIRIRREVDLRTAELNESRLLLETITDNNPSSIWVKDTALRFQFVNARFVQNHGGDRAAIIGRTDAEFYPPEIARDMERRDTEVIATGQTFHFEHGFELRGRRHTFLVTKFPLRRADGVVYAVAGVATDITALREAEARQLAIERKLLETQKLESLGVLAGGVAHDFNNLLTGILGHASLLRTLFPVGASSQASLQQIETAAQRAAELCRQMLAYSGRGRFSVQPVELGQLVRDTAALLQLSLARGAHLRFDIAQGLPPVVADLTQIRQIVMNLVINASESLVDETGDITLRIRRVRADAALFASCIVAPERADGDYVCLEVSDTGCGMTPVTMARVFDPFFTTKFTGRGLGLAAVLGIVRGHHGALGVESSPGRGTTFRLYFPAAPHAVGAGHGHAAESASPALPPGPNGAGLRLLLVDDEPAVRETATSLLHACGYEVDACADGETALRLFSASPQAHHAAVIDLTMPGLGGAALLQRLRASRPGMPVLVISGYDAHDSAVLDLLAAPGVAFLAKPFTLSALRARLEELLRPENPG